MERKRMKLRNKKTGRRGYIEYVMRTINPITGEPLLTVRYKDDSGITCYKDYETIEGFNEDWEDYKPSEPLIKDEKIRKFVRAWAEVNGFDVLKYLDGYRICEFSYRLKNSDGDVVMELLGGIDGLENCKEYTITELCGE